MLTFQKLYFIKSFKNKAYNQSGPGGGAIWPPDFLQALKQKLEKPVTTIFLTIPKYVYTLNSKKKKNLMGTQLRPGSTGTFNFSFFQFPLYMILFGWDIYIYFLMPFSVSEFAGFENIDIY